MESMLSHRRHEIIEAESEAVWSARVHSTPVSLPDSRNTLAKTSVLLAPHITNKNVKKLAEELAKRDGRDTIAICREIAGEEKAKSLESVHNRYVRKGHLTYNPPLD